MSIHKAVTKYLLNLLPGNIISLLLLGNRFMDNPSKGGRGKKAPYDSTHYRIPTPLKPICEKLASDYRELVTEYADPNAPGLLAAVLAASGVNGGVSQEELEYIQDNYETKIKELESRLESLHRLLEKPANEQEIILDALNNFIDKQRNAFGRNASQQGKTFSMDSRSWDNFNKFKELVEQNPDKLSLRH